MGREKESRTRNFAKAALTLLLLPIILPLALIGFILFPLHRATLNLLIWLLWIPRGKDVLLVYSDSPIWRDYMRTQVLPLVQERAVVLNWSERKSWPRWSAAHSAFRSFGGGREFNPLVVVYRPFRRAQCFRFFSPFKDWKRGNTEPVERMRQDLIRSL